jgi:hypothetical protein
MTKDEIAAAFAAADSALGAYRARCANNANVRYCLWAGQSPDGRKHSSKGCAAKPWEGASDQRVFVADDLISRDAALLLVSLERAGISATPASGASVVRSGEAAVLARWLLRSQVSEWRREVAILANALLTHGVAAMSVFWRREVSREPIVFRRSALDQPSEGLPDVTGGGDGGLAGLFFDPAREGEAADMLGASFSGVPRAELLAGVRELRAGRDATFWESKTVVDRPGVRALTVGVDLLFPPQTDDIDDAPAVFEVRWMTRPALYAAVASHGWDGEWVRQVVATGLRQPDVDASDPVSLMQSTAASDVLSAKVVFAYYRDEANGNAMRRRVFCPDVHAPAGVAEGDFCAVDELVASGPRSRYPFVVFAREHISRRLLDARGMAELCQSAQDEIKMQRDGRADHTELAHLPPLYHPLDSRPAAWGPFALIPRRRGDVRPYEYADVPPLPSGSLEIEQTLKGALNDRFGNPVSQDAGPAAPYLKQAVVNLFLAGCADVAARMHALWERHGPESVTFRVLGQANGQPVKYVRSVDGGRYDFHFDFDVESLDRKAGREQLFEVAKQLASYDRGGAVDWNKLLRMLVASYDPALADEILLPQEAAVAEEWRATRDDLTRIWAGMDIDFPDVGRSPAQASQIVDEYMRGSETIPALDVQQRYESDEAYRARLDKYRKQIQFRLSQQQNAATGRLGAKPGNMSAPVPGG